MAADGVIDPNETNMITSIVNGLDVDKDEVAKIRDKNIISIDQPDLSGDNLLSTLDIDPSLDEMTIKQKLSMEFQKWNNRLNIVSADEREDVQKMLNRIALARKEYD